MNEKTDTLVSNAAAALVGLLGAFVTMAFRGQLEQAQLVATTAFLTAFISLIVRFGWNRYSEQKEKAARLKALRAAENAIGILETKVESWTAKLERDDLSDTGQAHYRALLEEAFSELRRLHRILVKILRTELEIQKPLPANDASPPSSATLVHQLTRSGRDSAAHAREEGKVPDRRAS